jgi:hypothetical protein
VYNHGGRIVPFKTSVQKHHKIEQMGCCERAKQYYQAREIEHNAHCSAGNRERIGAIEIDSLFEARKLDDGKNIYKNDHIIDSGKKRTETTIFILIM